MRRKPSCGGICENWGMSEQLPQGWTGTTIGKLIRSGSLFADGDWVESKDQDPAGANRLIQLADIGDGKFLNKSSRFMNDEQFTRLRCTQLQEGDVLVARMPDPLGRACLFPGTGQRCATVVDIAIIRTKAADNYWLMSAINAPEFRRQIDINASGTTRTRISRRALSTITLSTPPIPEQQKIATILTSVDEVIDKTESQINKLQDLKKGMMQELLTKGIGHTEFNDSPVGWIPLTWEAKPLGTICDLQVGYAFKSNTFSDSGIRLLRGENVGYGEASWNNTKFLPEDLAESFSGYQLCEGDMVIGMDRTFTKSGTKISKIRQSDLPALLVQRVGRFTTSQADTTFVWQLIRSGVYLDLLKSQEKGMDIPHLSKSEILDPFVPVPPKDEQREIGVALQSVDHLIACKASANRQATRIKKALMQDLLTGKVRVKVS